MDQFIKALPVIMRDAGDSGEVAEAACFAAWNHAVGEGLRNNVMPMRLEERKLVVAVHDAIWQRQLKSMIGQLVSRVNNVLGQPFLKSVELQIRPELIRKSDAERKPVHNMHDIPQELLFAARKITDPELRRALLGAAASCLSRVEKKQI